MNLLTQFVNQFGTVWRGINAAQRGMLVGAIAAVIVGLGSVVFFTGQGDMTVLYAGLPQQDAAAVVSQLREQGVPYRLNEAGTTVYVPRQRVAETRLDLAQSGIPSGGGPGFELFDRSEFGITDFAQKVNFKRATEGELARTINRMAEVDFARVQLVMPQRHVFVRDEVSASASVFLSLKSGRELGRGQVRAIQHMVASAVERLSPGNVTITDQFARSLAAPADPHSTAALSASQLEVRRAVERSLQAKVQTLLDPVVGPGRSAVAVTVEIDFDRVERTEERFDPDSQVVRSEQRDTEKSSTTEPATTGAVGLTANLPTASGATGRGAAGSTSKSDSTITNYEINSTVEHIVKSPGTIKTVSVSAVVDGTYTTPAGGGEKQYEPRRAEDMANLERIILAAIGAGPTAKVEVLNVPLDTTVQEAEREAAEDARSMRTRELVLTIVRYVLIAVVALVAFNILRNFLARMAPRVARATALAGEGVAGAPGGRIDMMAVEVTETERRTQQIQEISKEQPAEVAALVKSWMLER